ncbi:CHAT domain-containing protein [Marinoscillum furvescens]|uniref:CHAT domain-containing protein n=1 Tax=Marinoscillum furvescens DSM 4134 TaxID=1122208 RepID=A0A3D9L158_MARFU|nr:CHAT domain-containing protein [Marinoscillum furvescens]RED97482.1 CHAT domain-containing protein [Marinoscillum furvescens DSM 4134]
MKKILILTFLASSLFLSGQQNSYQQALAQLEAGNYVDAFSSFQTAGEVFLTEQKIDLYSYCHLQMGKCHLAQGELMAAQKHLKSTLKYVREEIPDAAPLQVEGYLLLAETQLKLGRTDLALETLNKAEALLPAQDNLLAAECYNDLGVAHWNAQNHSVAIAYHEKALAIRKTLLPTNAPPIAHSYLNIGLIYLNRDFLQAVINFNNALNIYRTVHGPTHPQVALCYSNLAFANSSQGNFSDALRYIDQTMDIWNQTFADDHPNKAYTFSNKGRILEAQGDLDQALLAQQEALQIYHRLYGQKHPEIANTYYLLGSVLLKKNEYQSALEHFQKSIYANLYDQDFEGLYDLPQLGNYYDGNILLTSLQSKAQTLEAFHFGKTLSLNDLEASLATYQLADDLIAKLRQMRLNESDKLRIGTIAADIYSNAIRIGHYLSDKTFRKQHFANIAFGFCERSKSAVLLEAIGDTKAKSFAGIPDAIIQKEDSLQNIMAAIEQQLASKPKEPRLTTLKNELFEAQRAHNLFIQKLESDFPRYYELKYQPVDFDLSNLQAQLSPTTVLLSYYVSEDRVYIFEVSNEKIKVHAKALPDDFISTVSAYRNGMRYQLAEAFQPAASALYDLLIPDVKAKKLIIIPHGILGTVPFESFIIENENAEAPHYLIEDLEVSYDYAAQLFLSKASKASSTQGIFLAAPVSFDYPEMSLNELPASENEVKEIKYLFLGSSDKPTVWLNSSATESKLKNKDLSSYRYLHFATHGVVNPRQPALSRIFLSPDDQEDGNLYTGEIYSLDIGADLVTLSACETGLGKLQKGEGIIGLSRSLMYAGAKNLMVSLWQVADASTARLMIDFYRQHLHHSGNKTYADDLRNAKLKMLQSENYNQPYYWAPFILIGR